MNIKKDEDKQDEYKENNSEAPKRDESVINETEGEESLTDHLMPTNFPIKLINYVIVNISSCKQNIIEFGK